MEFENLVHGSISYHRTNACNFRDIIAVKKLVNSGVLHRLSVFNYMYSVRKSKRSVSCDLFG